MYIHPSKSSEYSIQKEVSVQSNHSTVLTPTGKKSVMVTTENKSIVYNLRGESLREFNWSFLPRKIVCSDIYIAALSFESELEFQINPCDEDSPINIKNIKSLEDKIIDISFWGPHLIALTSSDLFFLQRVRVEQIANKLVELKAFETALELLKSDHDGKIESFIRFSYGKYLLLHGDLEQGMLNLSQSKEADPIEILTFLEFLLPRELAEQGKRYLKDKLGYKAENIIQCPAENFLKGYDSLENICRVVLPYLLSYRSRLFSGNISSQTSLKLQMTLNDTAIFQCLFSLPDTGSLLQFLGGENHVEYESARSLLLQSGRYSELINLHRNYKHHSTALDIIRKLCNNPEEFEHEPRGVSADLKGLPGAWAAVRYLLSIKPPDTALVKFHSRYEKVQIILDL